MRVFVLITLAPPPQHSKLAPSSTYPVSSTLPNRASQAKRSSVGPATVAETARLESVLQRLFARCAEPVKKEVEKAVAAAAAADVAAAATPVEGTST